ncbi:protein of unknown function [Methylacidimicrobium sp. AP8]|nr:protein of unknown function [Methylacidimicrobium sp. AP8]
MEGLCALAAAEAGFTAVDGAEKRNFRVDFSIAFFSKYTRPFCLDAGPIGNVRRIARPFARMLHASVPGRKPRGGDSFFRTERDRT